MNLVSPQNFGVSAVLNVNCDRKKKSGATGEPLRCGRRYQVGAASFYIGTENSCAPTWHSAVATKSSREMKTMKIWENLSQPVSVDITTTRVGRNLGG